MAGVCGVGGSQTSIYDWLARKARQGDAADAPTTAGAAAQNGSSGSTTDTSRAPAPPSAGGGLTGLLLDVVQ